MATRATYTFRKESKYDWQKRPDVHCYIHYDGYPQGAATYFKCMSDLLSVRNDPDKNLAAGLRGGAVEQFLRANPLAELTGSADQHCDTEFHYDIFEGYNSDTRQHEVLITAYEFKWSPKDEEHKKVQFFHGFVDQFIEAYPWEKAATAHN